MAVRVTLARAVSLLQADSFVLGWQQALVLEAERMRAEFPDADMIEIRLIGEREESDDALPELLLAWRAV